MNGFSSGEEDSVGANPDQVCCLIEDNQRCNNPTGNACYSRRIKKAVAQKRLKLIEDPTAQHTYICDAHKTRIQSARSKRRRKDSDDDSNETDTDLRDYPDFHQMPLATLRRYKKYHKVPTRQGMKRDQLAEVIQKHFKTLPVREKEIITYFVYMIKSNTNKLDHKISGSSDAC